jgi:drug/metabolite transporter (DMT)-like permease
MNSASNNRLGILWILASVFFASLMSIGVRELSAYMDTRMIVMFRAGLLTVLIGVPILILPQFRSALRFSRPKLHLVRGVLIAFSTHLGFYTLANIPIATATVLFFTAPIFATILSSFINGEKVGPRRWSAVLAGFVGAVIVLRPGYEAFHIGMLTALGSSLMFAVALAYSRNLAVSDGAISTYFSSVVITAIVSVPLSLPVFSLPATWFVLTLGVIVALCSFVRGFSDIQGYRYAEAAVLAPVTYLRLVFLGVAGYILWGETFDTPTLIGASVIIGSTLYIGRREALLRRSK